jgi:pescadillo protein
MDPELQEKLESLDTKSLLALDLAQSNGQEKEQEAGEDATLEEMERKLTPYRTLFKGCYFYLCREVPKPSLVFIIRSFGGEVSWEGAKELRGGNYYTEDDPRITHQIVDRPSLPNRRADRAYIQPQWVYGNGIWNLTIDTNVLLL